MEARGLLSEMFTKRCKNIDEYWEDNYFKLLECLESDDLDQLA